MAECLKGCDLKGLGRFEPGDDIPVGELTKKTARWLVAKGVIERGDTD